MGVVEVVSGGTYPVRAEESELAMKIRVTLKDPDTMHHYVEDAVRAHVKSLEGLTTGERESLVESRAAEQAEIITDNWMEWGEYLEVEFDTEAMTATVIESGK